MPNCVRSRVGSLGLLSLALCAVAGAQVDSRLLANVQFRGIGPWRGGRSTAVTGVPGKEGVFFMGATGGGIWKTTDSGKSWSNVSDGFFTMSGSVGSIAVAESNPDVIYAGMGEAAPRGNITHGDGVWKSEDGGKTWRNVGLKDTQYIGMVRVSPKDPNTAYVAAIGHMYGRNAERGLYKTTDGGKNWTKILYVDDGTGCVDVSLDATDPNTIYASTWEVYRTPFLLSSGGPGCHLWKSTDGGAKWTDLSRNPGMPQTGLLGKICVDVSAKDSKRVYAMVEHQQSGGLYRSDDAGATWSRVNSDANIRQRAWYFSRVIANPVNADSVVVLNVQAYRSTDGGKTIRPFVAQHVDNHDFYFDHKNPDIQISANDGGASVTTDGGKTWSEQSMPTGQFYHVSADNAFPYRIYGCQQDNSSVRIASRTFGAGIGSTDWEGSAGGESGYLVADPLDPDVAFGGNYDGNLDMRNDRLNLSRSLNPWPEAFNGGGVENAPHRFQWTFPIVFSPTDPKTMYVGSQFVLRSRDHGQNWQVISPDLTTNNKAKQGSSGGPITKDNTGVEVYCTVFTIAPSPKKAGVIWAGSDDGLVHITRNDGKSWQNVTPQGMPKDGLCSLIEASPTDPATAYLAVDNHENDDLRPYIFITNDFGKTWRRADAGIPADTYVRAVRQDPVEPRLLFAGAESGLFVSFDAGSHWQRFQGNLPIVPIHDLIIKEDDLCLATHGRGFWILDDISWLRQVARVGGDQPFLYQPKQMSAMTLGFGGPVNGNAGRNPMTGLVATYYLPESTDKASLKLIDSTGAVVTTVARVPGEKGLNRVQVNARYQPNSEPSGPGGRRQGGIRALRAPAGKYTFELTVDGKKLTVPVDYAPDPRTGQTVADTVEQYRFSKIVLATVQEVSRQIERMEAEAGRLERFGETDDAAKSAAVDLRALIDEYRRKPMSGGQESLGYPDMLAGKLNDLFGTVQSGQWRPTSGCYQVYDKLMRDKAALDAKYAALKKAKIDQVNTRRAKG